MNKNNFKYIKLVALAATLPFIYGCGGAGIGSLVSFLFGGGGLGSIGDIALLGGIGGGIAGAVGGAAGGGAAGLATLSQPEPASMLLLGSGLMTMSYFKAKAGRRNK